MIVFVSGKYTGKTTSDTFENIALARKIAIELWEKGYVVMCPHLNTISFEIDCKASYDDYLKGYLKILLRCDAIILLPNWEQSNGSKQEYQFALDHHIPVYIYPNLPIISCIEQDCPKQTTGFMDIIMNMYRMYLRKNHDYGNAPILGTGCIGLVTRMWDKMTRIMHLSGFRIDVKMSEFSLPVSAQFEPLDDSFSDISVYSVIAQIYRNGDWGK